MAYMRGTNYIFGSADWMEFHIGDARKEGVQSLLLDYDICDQFVLMRHQELSWRRKRELGKLARREHGRPEHWFPHYVVRPLRLWRVYFRFNDLVCKVRGHAWRGDLHPDEPWSPSDNDCWRCGRSVMELL